MDFADLMAILVSDANYEVYVEIMKKIVAVLKNILRSINKPKYSFNK